MPLTYSPASLEISEVILDSLMYLFDRCAKKKKKIVQLSMNPFTSNTEFRPNSRKQTDSASIFEDPGHWRQARSFDPGAFGAKTSTARCPRRLASRRLLLLPERQWNKHSADWSRRPGFESRLCGSLAVWLCESVFTWKMLIGTSASKAVCVRIGKVTCKAQSTR